MGLFRKRRKVGEAGIPGTAKVLAADSEDFWRDSPGDDEMHLAEFGLGHVVNDLTMEVTLNDGRAPYGVHGKFKVPTKLDSHVVPGASIPLFADPDDPTIIEFNWHAFEAAGGNPPPDAGSAEFKSDLYDGFPAASRAMMIDGWVNAVNAGGMSREKFDEAVGGGVKSGILNADDAAQARARLD